MRYCLKYHTPAEHNPCGGADDLEGNDMEERRNAIVELVNQQGSVSFAQLREAFPQVSEMTLRTDLKQLDQERRLVRVHGGARSVEMVAGTDGYLRRRIARNAEAKQLIAQKAVKLLRPNCSLFLDSGSTTTAVAECLPDEPYLIYTSSLTCAAALARLEKPRIFLPGGTMNRYSMSICGVQGIRELEKINFDWLFLGATTYSPECGFACGAREETLLKQTVLRRASKTAVLLDSSKLGRKSTFTICSLGEVDAVVSDGDLPEDFLAACRASGVAVY